MVATAEGITIGAQVDEVVWLNTEQLIWIDFTKRGGV